MDPAADINMDRADVTEEQQTSISRDNTENTENSGLSNEENIISSEACMKFITALKEFESMEFSSTLEAEKAIRHVFNSLPSAEPDYEISSCRAFLPVAPDVLTSKMLDMECWALSLSHIVHRVSSNVPPSIFQQLSNSDTTIKGILKINADLQLPAPLIQNRSFNFYRVLKQIAVDAWVIFDISADYFLYKSGGSLGQNVWRRRSAVIVQKLKDGSKVSWVENVQVPACQLQANMYSGLMTSNMGFSARRWLSTLMSSFDRSHSRFVDNKLNLNAQNLLLKLTERMKMIFLDLVNETPDDRKWVTLSNQNVRVMRSRTDTVNIPSTHSYISVTTFPLVATPSEAFAFLAWHFVRIPWAQTEYPHGKGHEEIIKYESVSNRITLLKRGYNEKVRAGTGKYLTDYLLQEDSKDGLCSFVVAAPLTQTDVYSSLFSGIERDVILCPAGFAILPDGLDSKTSLVTIVVNHPINVKNTEEDCINPMKSVTECIIMDIKRDSKLLSSKTVS